MAKMKNVFGLVAAADPQQNPENPNWRYIGDNWKCRHELVRVHPARFRFGNDNNGISSTEEAVVYPVGIIRWDDAIPIGEWTNKFLKNSHLQKWTTENGIDDVRKNILKWMPKKDDEKELAEEALVNEAVTYHPLERRLVGQEATTTILANHFECRNAANLTIQLLGEATKQNEGNAESSVAQLPLDFTKHFDFLSKWETMHSNVLDVLYLPGKMRRKSYIFQLFVGAIMPYSKLKKWKKAQMMAAFKCKFGFSYRARKAFPAIFNASNANECAKRNNDSIETDPFCWARTNSAIQKDIRFFSTPKSHMIGWAVNKGVPAFKLIVKELQFMLSFRHTNFFFAVPEIDYKKLDAVEAKQLNGHEFTNRHAIFPDEFDDPSFPEIYAD